ncbi:hypothetical protein ACEV7J_01315 [Vibrio parahaemolyticus]|uniref:hypothetical protein n=1 Tax=Vibrio parahaemolyticus TaxID=670 RepID=UPI002554C197|nr:hypothetical protein [Vibrio parahaemolyticus]
MDFARIFQSATQYDDFKGSITVDESDDMPQELLKKIGISESEFIVAIEMTSGECHDKHKKSVYVDVFVSTPMSSEDALSDPEHLRKISTTLTLYEFFCLFKRVSLTLSRKGLLEGKEIE